MGSDKIGVALVEVKVVIQYILVFRKTETFPDQYRDSMPMPEPIAPTFAAFDLSGPYEMVVFILMTVATYNQFHFALTEEMRTLKNLHRIDPVPRMSLEQWIRIGLAITLILLAGWREAAMIMTLWKVEMKPGSTSIRVEYALAGIGKTRRWSLCTDGSEHAPV